MRYTHDLRKYRYYVEYITVSNYTSKTEALLTYFLKIAILLGLELLISVVGLLQKPLYYNFTNGIIIPRTFVKHLHFIQYHPSTIIVRISFH